MKKLKMNYFFAAAMLLASGMAVATEVVVEDPNVYNANAGTGTPNWQPIPAGTNINCDLNPERNCKAFRSGTGAISSVVKGYQL